MDEFIAHRKRTQPPGASLGSIFKNPPGDYAGRLIELCGLKGAQDRRGAGVAGSRQLLHQHGGASASASDYYRLIRLVQDVVHEKTGVLLETEVELLGEGF